jgi:von Willebrand factor type A domain
LIRAAIALVVAATLAAAGAPPAHAQSPTTTDPIMLLVDTSGSMSENDQGGHRTKIDGAKLALLDFIAAIEPGTPVGLRHYPVNGGSGCDNGERLQALQPVEVTGLSRAIRGLHADGDTPTAEAMRAAAADLQAHGGGHGTLVLVSDGHSTCDDPCKAAKQIAAKGIDLETITVGFRIDDEGRKELECIADALDGRYVDADNGEDVSAAVREASTPQLAVKISNPTLRTVADSPVQLEADVSNSAQVEARDVVARLRFRGLSEGAGSGDFSSPGVRRPVQRLGNLGPQVPTRRVIWTFRPGGALLPSPGGSRTLVFHVVASASNSAAPVEQTLTVTVTDATKASDAGPILAGRKLAILGDSFSAGEGAGGYILGTASSTNRCHRSRRTYLMEVFSIPNEHLLACSGAVINDLEVANEGNGVPAQREQLRDIMKDGIGAAALTLSGNDVGFSGLAVSCLIYPTIPCNERVVSNSPYPLASDDANSFLESTVGNDAFMLRLVEEYAALNGNLNNDVSYAKRGGAAPILVLAYPIPVPLTGRSCGPMFDLLSPHEIDYVVSFVTRLNAQIERAVALSHRNGVPVFFIPTTETAFLPEHTVCDGDPYARALNSFSGVIPREDAARLPDDFRLEDLEKKRGPGRPPKNAPKPSTQGSQVKGGVADLALKYAIEIVAQGKNQLVHPNRNGYAAMTRAILRWSRTPEARADAESLKSVKPVPLLPTWTVSQQMLGQLAPGSTPQLQGGTAYPISGDGYAPDTELEVSIHSAPRLLALTRTDAGGRFHALLGIPRSVPDGHHTLTVAGVGRDGRPRREHLSVEVSQQFRWSVPVALGITAASALLLGVLALLVAVAIERWQRARRGVSNEPPSRPATPQPQGGRP